MMKFMGLLKTGRGMGALVSSSSALRNVRIQDNNSVYMPLLRLCPEVSSGTYP